MPDKYFYKTLGIDFGPVSLSKIRELRRQEVLGPSDHFRVQGGKWRVVADMDADALLAATTPPSTVAPAEPTPWVVWTKSGEVGPLTTGQFLAAIQSGEVEPKTQVRFQQNAQWIAAGDIPGLEFPSNTPLESVSISTPSGAGQSHSNKEMRQLFAECVTRQRSSQPTPTPAHAHSPTPRVSLPTGWTGGLSAGITFVVGVFALIVDWLLFALGFALRSRIVWAGTCVLLLVMLIPKVTADWITPEQDYATLSGTFTEWKELRTQNVDETTWEEFQERSSSQLSELIPRIEKRAHITDRSSMSLMWVARDYLPTLLLDPASPAPEVVSRIEAHFAIIDLYKQSPIRTPASRDPWMGGIVVLDLLGVLGAALFFGRKRWAKASRPGSTVES